LAAKPTALLLTAESPYPTIGGGAMRTASILEYLRQHYITDVISFQQPAAPAVQPPPASPSSPAVRRWLEIPLPAHHRGSLQRGWRNLRRALRGTPPLVDRFAGFHTQVAAALGDCCYDLAIIEHFWCAPYAATLRPHARRMVLDLHNIESLWHRRCAATSTPILSPFYHAFARAAARLERRLLPRFDLVLTTSSQECHWITEQFPALVVSPVANTLPLLPRPAVTRRDGIVFSGNMEYLPNQQAVRHFASAIWPLIARRFPDLHLKILGKSAQQLHRFVVSSPRVILLSDPDDAMMEIAQSKVAVVPLTMGTGTRLKILEAWAAACPVVSTPVGAEGLQYEDGIDILIRSSPSEFASAVVVLLESDTERLRLGDAGRKRFEECYSWERAWLDLRNCGV
jgi:glycosyltransferase involved in cell wall biosynthesis